MTTLCHGAEDHLRQAVCEGPDVRDVAFRLPAPAFIAPWNTTQWCADCRTIAKANGYEVITWTEYSNTCTRCNKPFRISQEAIDAARPQYEPTFTSVIASTIEFCLGCVDADSPAGEYDVPPVPVTVEPTRSATHKYDGHFQITGLTARDIFAIHAALEVACDDEDEPYPGLNDALAKVVSVVKDLRAAGAEPPSPETSVQSQSFIDGVAPWFDRDESPRVVDVEDSRDRDCDGRLWPEEQHPLGYTSVRHADEMPEADFYGEG